MTGSRERAPLMQRLAALGGVDGDAEDERLRRSTLVLSTSLICVLTPLWVVTYLALGLPVPTLIPAGYLVVTIASLVWFARTRCYVPFRTFQLTLMLLLPFALQWSLGGFAASSAVSLWGLWPSLGAVLFVGGRGAVGWFAGYLALLAVSAAIDPVLEPAAIPDGVQTAFFVANVTGPSLVAYLLLRYFVRERDREHERSERLLLNVLPAVVAARLKHHHGVIADRLPEATVLFADIVDFTPLAVRLPPEDVVKLLDQVFTAFDRLADDHRLEKIKTIGDAYMVAGGVPTPRKDHCEAVAEMALAMLEVSQGLTGLDAVKLRIGMDTGPVVAGVIGQRKFSYDLWGDTVNTASRLESHGVPGSIQVSSRVYESLRGRYRFEQRGLIDLKGKGPTPAWLLLGPRA